jgi:hypothetical protein
MILLDLSGPMTVFNIMRAGIHLVAKTMAPVATDVGISLMPTMTFAECPAAVLQKLIEAIWKAAALSRRPPLANTAE